MNNVVQLKGYFDMHEPTGSQVLYMSKESLRMFRKPLYKGESL